MLVQLTGLYSDFTTYIYQLSFVCVCVCVRARMCAAMQFYYRGGFM